MKSKTASICEACVLLAAISFTTAHADLITYRLIDGAAGDQNGHKIEGTITLDPACASSCMTLPAWEYTITGPTLNRSANSADVGPLFINFFGLFRATPEGLFVDYGSVAPAEELLFDLAGLAWNIEGPPGQPTVLQYFAYDFDAGLPGGASAGWNTTPQATTIQIATAVPEPSPFALLGLISVVAACLRTIRRRMMLRT